MTRINKEAIGTTEAPRTPVQWFALLAGAALVAAGVLSHAILGGLGLLLGLIPESAHRRAGIGDREHPGNGHASRA